MSANPRARGFTALGLNALLLGGLLLLGAPQRLGHANVWFFLFCALLFAYLEAAGQRASDSCQRAPWSSRYMGLSLLLLSAVSLLLGAPVSFMGIVLGTCCMLLGSTLRALAMAALGPRFTTEVIAAPDRGLVTQGIYRHLRHPSEAGLLCIGLGTPISLGWTFGYLFWALVFAPLVMLRLRREDADLHRLYGHAYSDYAQRVGALGIPGRGMIPEGWH